MLGITRVPYHDAGQSGRAEQTLTRLGVTAPAVEDVLIQARGPGRTFATAGAVTPSLVRVCSARPDWPASW